MECSCLLRGVSTSRNSSGVRPCAFVWLGIFPLRALCTRDSSTAMHYRCMAGYRTIAGPTATTAAMRLRMHCSRATSTTTEMPTAAPCCRCATSFCRRLRSRAPVRLLPCYASYTTAPPHLCHTTHTFECIWSNRADCVANLLVRLGKRVCCYGLRWR